MGQFDETIALWVGCALWQISPRRIISRFWPTSMRDRQFQQFRPGCELFGTPVVLVGTTQDVQETDWHVTRVLPLSPSRSWRPWWLNRDGRYALGSLDGDGQVAGRIAEILAALSHTTKRSWHV